jgi:hypothetical protein
MLYGSNKKRSAENILKSREITGKNFREGNRITKGCCSGYGGHFRAIQSFKYLGMNN